MSGRRRTGTLDLVGGRVEMHHGGGGRAGAELVEHLFARALDNRWLRKLEDAASIERPPGRIAIATDAHVVSPLFFPGGDIGSLAVHGTVNDVAMSGARPLYMSAAFVLEEGFALGDLARIADSMGEAARAAGVSVVAGDTKVVERGKGDGVFIATTGVGVIPDAVDVRVARVRPGDRVLLSGAIAEHGVAILSRREGIEFGTSIVSDSAALGSLVADLLRAVPAVHCMRDPTRGGVAAALNEIAHQACVGIELDESRLPIRAQVHGACELLGLDPLNVANEGKLLAFVAPGDAGRALAALRAHPLGREASEIGEVVEDPDRFVQMRTAFGGRRMVDWLTGEQLPRIC